MTNPFYGRAFDVNPTQFARSLQVEGEFDRVAQGFDAVEARLAAGDAFDAEQVAARQGKASLLLNLARYISTFSPATGNVDLGGFLLRNAGAPELPSDLTNRAYVDALVITATAPAWMPTEAPASKTLANYESVTVTVAGQVMTLPAAPVAGVSRVRVRTRPGIGTTVNGNGKPIMGLMETMSMVGRRWCELAFENNTDGWVLA